MEKIRPTPKENSQSFVSLGYPTLLTLITGLATACNLSRNDTQMLIPRGAAVITILAAISVISGAYILIKGRNRK